MPRRVGKDQGAEAALARGARLGAMGLLLSGNVGISTAFGMLLLLPLYVQKLGGDEASFGIVMAAATIPAGLSIGLLIRYRISSSRAAAAAPERLESGDQFGKVVLRIPD